jgi:DNA-binding XRE family transcriptional regulator
MQEMTLKELGNLMRNLRIAKNKELRQNGESEITQNILAEKIGVSLTTISDWEQGKTQPGVLNFIKFCHALNINVDEVIDENIEEDRQFWPRHTLCQSAL